MSAKFVSKAVDEIGDGLDAGGKWGYVWVGYR